MPSRWAYEAVAVHQFKGNRFTREFFEFDRTSNNASYEAFRIQYIEQTLNDIRYNISDGIDPENYAADLKLVQNELKDLRKTGMVASFGSLEGFTPSGFNETVYVTAMDSLYRLKQVFGSVKSKADRMKDRHVSTMIQAWGGEENFVEMKKKYTNKRLEQLLEKKDQFVTVWHDRLVRKNTPIYQEPRSRMARAHLFSSEKRLGPFSFDTYWFNLVVIWLSAVVLYFTLVYDLLRRIVNWNQIRKLRKSN